MAKNRVRAVSFSSEHPVERWFGMEVLDHSPRSVRMDYLTSGRAPLLLDHDSRKVVGVVQSASIAGKRGVAEVRFGPSPLATEALADVDDGVRANTSVGYRVLGMVLESSDETCDTYRVDDWEPLEITMTAIGADPTVGAGRNFATRAEAITVSPAQGAQPTRRAASMADETPEQIAAREAETALRAQQGREYSLAQEAARQTACRTFGELNNMPADTITRWIKEGTSLDKVGDEIKAVHELRSKASPYEQGTVGLTARETQQYSVFKAIRAMRYGSSNAKFIEEAKFEIEVSRAVGKKVGREHTSNILIPTDILQRPVGREAAQRALATTPGSKGGYLVDLQVMGFIDILRNRSVANQMGVTVLTGLTGNLAFPRQTGKPSVTWQAGEGVSVTAADQTLGQLSMAPKTAVVVTDVSEQLLQQASMSVEQFVMADLAAVIAIDGVDAAVIGGTGGAQPLGIRNTPGITTGQDAGTITYAKALAFPVVAGGSNAIRSNPGWGTRIAGAAICMQRQRFTSTDTPIWEGNLMDGTLVGFRAMSSEQFASGELMFGSWGEVIVGEWGVLELAMDNGGTRFNQMQVGIRASWMVDTLLRYPQSFVVSSNLS